MSLGSRTQWVLLAAVFSIALAVRVAPAWHSVYGGDGVNLQGDDAYYHFRSIESLIATFPWRSGFDPYALFPGGMNLPTGPFFDYAVASVAMALGGGDPSPQLVQHVAAWVPPLFGALAVLPAFWLGRILLGPWAGLIAASWLAVCTGHTVVYAKLGFADHHVFETLFYALALLFLSSALRVESSTRYAVAAGAALGFALLNRPAGAFLGALFGVAGGLLMGLDLVAGRSSRRVAAVLASMLLLGWVFLLPAGVGAWGLLPHLAMGGGLAAALGAWGLAELVRARGWPVWVWLVLVVLACVAGIAAISLAAPSSMGTLVRGFSDAIAGGGARLVAEVRPLLRFGDRWSLRPLMVELGPAGLFALPAFAVMARAAIRARDRVLFLVSITGLLLFPASLLQARMTIYVAVNIAAAVGWCVWKLLEGERLRRRLAYGAISLLVLFAPMAAYAIELVALELGTTPEWRSATDWLRANTPEPLGDPEAFLRYYPRLADDEAFDCPAGAYGVLAWWDRGYWILANARRAPTTNGTQARAVEAAAFFAETEPRKALDALDALLARYVITAPTDPLVPFEAALSSNSQFRAMIGWTGEEIEDYVVLHELPRDGGATQFVFVFLPKYYRSMTARLYLHDGQAYEPRNATSVLALRPGKSGSKMISSQRTFGTYDEARRYIEARPDQDLVLGSLDPFKSCVPLDAVEGLKLVYNSTPGDVLGRDGRLHAVKIFERTGIAAPAPAAE